MKKCISRAFKWFCSASVLRNKGITWTRKNFDQILVLFGGIYNVFLLIHLYYATPSPSSRQASCTGREVRRGTIPVPARYILLLLYRDGFPYRGPNLYSVYCNLGIWTDFYIVLDETDESTERESANKMMKLRF